MRINWAIGFLTSLSALCFTTGVLRLSPSTPLLIALCIMVAMAQYLSLDRLYRRNLEDERGEVLREVEDLLHNLSIRLSQGASFEAAFQEVAQLHRGRVRKLLIKASRELTTGHTAEEALRRFLLGVRAREASRLLLLVPRLSSYSSQRAGFMLMSVVELLERNRALKERLAASVRREGFKVNVLSTLYPMVLAALYLLLRVASWLTSSLDAMDLLTLNFTLASLSAVAPFYASLITTGRGSVVRSITSLSIYASLQIVFMSLLSLSSSAGF